MSTKVIDLVKDEYLCLGMSLLKTLNYLQKSSDPAAQEIASQLLKAVQEFEYRLVEPISGERKESA